MNTKIFLTAFYILWMMDYNAQGPGLTSWLQNSTQTGSYYLSGNTTLIQDTELANVQLVQYTTNNAFISTEGVPAYPTGPFLDNNPTVTTAQNIVYRIPLLPVQNTSGSLNHTTGGNIGIFINGVSLFDYRDGVSFNYNANQDQGGPGSGVGDGVWNRDAVIAERDGFDCSKGHPAQGNYHHHQNPSAFKLDLNTTSTICNLYDADGLYSLDSTQHSPLIGFAYDGFPIYGGYAYTNTDGTGGISRIKSSYFLRNISVRTHYADGTDVIDGPDVSPTFPLGHYREDYEFISSNDQNRLDAHNGRFCVTPEYPDGTYAYFATVNDDWTSAYPYVVGPYFYGVKTGGVANNVPQIAETYTPSINTNIENQLDLESTISVFPNPTSEIIVIQYLGLVTNKIELSLFDMTGKLVLTKYINPGSTLAHIDTQTLYAGNYILVIKNNEIEKLEKIVITK